MLDLDASLFPAFPQIICIRSRSGLSDDTIVLPLINKGLSPSLIRLAEALGLDPVLF